MREKIESASHFDRGDFDTPSIIIVIFTTLPLDFLDSPA
jgi:hypothetical protein